MLFLAFPQPGHGTEDSLLSLPAGGLEAYKTSCLTTARLPTTMIPATPAIFQRRQSLVEGFVIGL